MNEEGSGATPQLDLTLADTAKRLGISSRGVWYHIGKGHLREDYRIGETLMFTPDTLDKFVSVYMKAGGWTINEIVQRWIVPLSTIRWHMRQRKIEAVGRRNGKLTYDTDEISRLASELGWPTGESISS